MAVVQGFIFVCECIEFFWHKITERKINISKSCSVNNLGVGISLGKERSTCYF